MNILCVSYKTLWNFALWGGRSTFDCLWIVTLLNPNKNRNTDNFKNTDKLSIEKELLTTLSSVYHFSLQSHVHFKHFFSFPHVFFLFSRYWDLTNIFNYSLHRRRKLQIKFKRYERRYDPSLEPVYLLDCFRFKSFFRNRY